jgi:hypothetical protein
MILRRSSKWRASLLGTIIPSVGTLYRQSEKQR